MPLGPRRDGTASPLIHTSISVNSHLSISGQVWGPQGEQPPHSMTDFQPGAGGDGGGARALSRLPQWVTPPLRHTAWFFPLPGNPSKKESPARGPTLRVFISDSIFVFDSVSGRGFLEGQNAFLFPLYLPHVPLIVHQKSGRPSWHGVGSRVVLHLHLILCFFFFFL